ncbi:Panacea domain-containing protein [Viscerimonas tarda]
MKSIADISKIKATVLYILNSFPEGVDYIKFFKIMYFAQQDHLVKYGKPIFNEAFHALKHGPVPSFTYKIFQVLDGRKNPIDDLSDFSKSFKIENGNKNPAVYLVEQPNLDELSKSDIKSLDLAIAKCKDISSYDLSEKSHDKAWEEAYSRSQDDPEKDRISLIEIAKAGNASTEIIDYIREKEQLKRALSL